METSIGHVTRNQLQVHHLWDRIVWAKKHIEPRQSQYRVVFEDKHAIAEPVRVMVPDPNWLAMAMRGDIVPAISAYLQLPLLHVYSKNGVIVERTVFGGVAAGVRWAMLDEGWKFEGEKVLPGHSLHTAETCPAMTEEQAIEYLLMKDVPQHVWVGDDGSNSRKIVICNVDQIPTDRSFRNSWSLVQ